MAGVGARVTGSCMLTGSCMEVVFSSPVLDTDELHMALRARKVSGAFKNEPQGF